MGTGSRRTREKQYGDDESTKHARTRTQSVNATVPLVVLRSRSVEIVQFIEIVQFVEIDLESARI